MSDDSAVRRRAIDYIRKHWGALNDLPEALIPVIWVTVYRGLEIGMKVEAEGGARALTKNTLISDGKLSPALQIAAVKIDYLDKMIALIRSHKTEREKLADSRLVIYMLKWNIISSGRTSFLGRSVAWLFARKDPAYKKPSELMR
jgi:hypothetical protein